ncbi:MAG TPA: glycosyl hydrolase [Streptosporangiaceae bacterium]|nr:glycosyl hydrolase [Streptosporangiaceae bacterium]
MKPRLVMCTALVIAAAAVAAAVSHISTMHNRGLKVVHASLPVSLASYLGVFEAGSPPSYRPVAEFAAAADREPDIVGSFSGWAQPFDSSFARGLEQRHTIPFVQIDPTFASISAITAGDYDTYLKAYADSVVDFGHPVIIGFGHEMNAPWYAWGYGRLSPASFVKAWRYIVNLFRSRGADNVTWLWTINADRPGTGPVADWWPGRRYVTWVGIDGYYYHPSDSFMSVFGKTIDQVRAFTRDPILLSETAVGPRAGQLLKIQDLFHGMAKYKTLGLVWFDKDQDSGIFHQDWRIEDSQTAEYSFRLGIRDELTPIGKH